jgi:hypothetical protein
MLGEVDRQLQVDRVGIAGLAQELAGTARIVGIRHA